MFCSSCGCENRDEASFCANCGRELSDERERASNVPSPGVGKFDMKWRCRIILWIIGAVLGYYGMHLFVSWLWP